MSSITVEPAGRDDVDAIVDGWVALARDQRTHGSHLLAAENRSTVRENVTHHVVGGRIFVAKDDDCVVGFVQYSTTAGTYHMDIDRGIVETLYVDLAVRNEGIGSRLLERAERAMAADDVGTVSLEVMATNEDGRRFYENNGYRVHRVSMEKSLENDTH